MATIKTVAIFRNNDRNTYEATVHYTSGTVRNFGPCAWVQLPEAVRDVVHSRDFFLTRERLGAVVHGKWYKAL